MASKANCAGPGNEPDTRNLRAFADPGVHVDNRSVDNSSKDSPVERVVHC